MRVENHPKLILTREDIDKINEITRLVGELFDNFIEVSEDHEFDDLAIEFESRKDGLLDFFEEITCGDNCIYSGLVEIKSSQSPLTRPGGQSFCTKPCKQFCATFPLDFYSPM